MPLLRFLPRQVGPGGEAQGEGELRGPTEDQQASQRKTTLNVLLSPVNSIRAEFHLLLSGHLFDPA